MYLFVKHDSEQEATFATTCLHCDTVTICVIAIVPVHGGWGNWTSFPVCSRSCGGGTQTRERECDSPNPSYGGDSCAGNENETQPCNTKECPGQALDN